MARGFRIHSGAVFNPFTLKELREPIQEYNQAYSQMQDYMLAAGEEANQYKQLVDNDEYASGILRGYNSTLSDISGQLSREGLKAINKGTILGLRRKYNEEVKPVNDAAKTLAGLQETYRQMYAKDPTTMRGAMPTIKELIDNPAATPIITSGTSLYNQGVNAAKAASQRKQDFKVRLNGIVRGYIDTVQTSGYNSAEAQMFLNEASRQPELQEIFNQIYNANSVSGLEDPSRGSEWILRGILDGMVYDQKTDLKYDQYGAEMRAAARAAAKSGSGEQNTFGKTVSPFNLYSQKERTEAVKNIDKFKEMFDWTNDKGWVMSKKGINTYNNYNKVQEALKKSKEVGYYGTSGYMNVPPEFIKFIDSIKQNDETPEQAWARYYSENEEGLYDATRSTGYRYIPDSNDEVLLRRLLVGHADDGKVYTVDYNTSTKRFDKEKKISLDDITNISDIEMTPQGFVMNVGTKKNGSTRIMLPPTGGERMNFMQNVMFPSLDNTRQQFVEGLQKLGYPYNMYTSDPETARMIAYSNGDMDVYNWISEMLNGYAAGIQGLYNEMANTYRSTSAKEETR